MISKDNNSSWTIIVTEPKLIESVQNTNHSTYINSDIDRSDHNNCFQGLDPKAA